MFGPEMLLCDKCHTMRLHRPEGTTAAKCDACGTIRDAAFEFAPLDVRGVAWCAYFAYLYRTKALTEYPQQPGVWRA